MKKETQKSKIFKMQQKQLYEGSVQYYKLTSGKKKNIKKTQLFSQSCFYEKVIKIDKPLDRLIKKKEGPD